MAGINLVHVPYKGDAPAVTAVLANQVPMMFPTFPVALPYIKAGKLSRCRGIEHNNEHLLPDVPTITKVWRTSLNSPWSGWCSCTPGNAKGYRRQTQCGNPQSSGNAGCPQAHRGTRRRPSDRYTRSILRLYTTETAQWLKVARAAKLKPIWGQGSMTRPASSGITIGACSRFGRSTITYGASITQRARLPAQRPTSSNS